MHSIVLATILYVDSPPHHQVTQGPAFNVHYEVLRENSFLQELWSGKYS